jgi:hypothetical protein
VKVYIALWIGGIYIFAWMLWRKRSTDPKARDNFVAVDGPVKATQI